MSKSEKPSAKKLKKHEEHNILKTLVPYFKLAISDIGGRVKCKLGGYAQPNDKIQDELIESKDDNKKEQYGMYDIGYMTNHCNISGSYLVKNDKLPIYCKNVLYSRQFLSGNLFTCFLYFTIDEQTKNMTQNRTKKVVIKGVESTISDYSKYYNLLMSGKFTLELMTIDDDLLEKFTEYKRNMLENEYMVKYCEEFEIATLDEKDNILLKISEEIENKLETYKNMFKPIEIENPKKSKVINLMDKMINSQEMSELIEFGLKHRDKKRIEESCPDQTFERPKKVINLKELYENQENLDEEIDKLLGNYGDSEDSEDLEN